MKKYWEKILYNIVLLCARSRHLSACELLHRHGSENNFHPTRRAPHSEESSQCRAVRRTMYIVCGGMKKLFQNYSPMCILEQAKLFCMKRKELYVEDTFRRFPPRQVWSPAFFMFGMFSVVVGSLRNPCENFDNPFKVR